MIVLYTYRKLLCKNIFESQFKYNILSLSLFIFHNALLAKLLSFFNNIDI